MKIRMGHTRDLESLQGLYADAFPDEDLFPLVRALLDTPDDVLSLVAEPESAGDSGESTVAGHILFTHCAVSVQSRPVSLLGPLAVHSVHQRQGIGGALIREGLERLRQSGCVKVLVLGDPGYYARAGFRREDGIRPPYPLPDAWAPAWQSLALDDDAAAWTGTLQVPGPWQDAALWAE